MTFFKQSLLALSVASILSTGAIAQQTDTNEEKESSLETITVTAQKRTQSIQDVPISIATLHGEKFESLFSGGDDILALAVRVPGLYAESSNGRVAPRFYIRGLGNSDFDLAASQPVSIIMDEVVMENVVLKSFPLFDIQQVEVIRGPQGTLFGRNTTAGIIKFDSVKPSEDFDAYVKSSVGSYGTVNIEAAAGGALANDLSGRFSVLSQQRDDYIDNGANTQGPAMGGFDELAWRGQLLYSPSEDLDVLLQLQGRDLEGTASIFRANVFNVGSNDLNSNYDRDRVYYDGDLLGTGFDNNPQAYDSFGSTLKVDYDFGDVTLTSITAYVEADGFSLGDVDGGAGVGNTPNSGFIPFPSATQDNLEELEQITQEIRFASDTNDALSWQVGAFYFDASFGINTNAGFNTATVLHDNSTWAVFGQTSYAYSDKFSLTAGVRYTNDDKSLRVVGSDVAVDVDDGQVSYELSANYKLNSDVSLFARYANGFRAQSIQGRDIVFFGPPSVAEAETINSIEGGIKADLMDDTLRINAAVFYYTVDDLQISAIGGNTNGNALLNADKGRAVGFEIDAQYLVNEYLTLSAGYSFNDTKIEDDNLLVAPCGASCTVTDPMNADGAAFIDGNPFPNAPETTLSFTARYAVPAGDDGEFFAFTDWAMQGKTNLFLYESVEFQTNDQFEGGLRVGYENFSNNYSIALFARNITDEDNVKGAIDFNNLTGIVNEPRIIGIEGKISFY